MSRSLLLYLLILGLLFALPGGAGDDGSESDEDYGLSSIAPTAWLWLLGLGRTAWRVRARE